MGETGEAFKTFNQMKAEERAKLEPQREKYAFSKLTEVCDNIEHKHGTIVIHLPKGTITLWPYSGWFQGQKPYGKIRGRGIANLVTAIKNLDTPQTQ